MTRSRALSLAAGSMLPLSAEETARAAAAASFTHVGVRMVTARPGAPIHMVPGASTRIRRFNTLLADLGLGVLDFELVALRPETQAADHLRDLEAAALVGASYVIALGYDRDLERTAWNLAAVAQLAKPMSLTLMLEFVPYNPLSNLHDALGVIAKAAAENIGLLLDPLHVTRSGSTPRELRGIPHELTPYCQLCDAPIAAPADLLAESSSARLLPGEGELPLAEFLAELPVQIGLSVEVQGLEGSAHMRAERAMESVRRLLTAVPGGPTKQLTDESVI